MVEDSLREMLAYAESIVDTVREPLLELDAELRIRTASRAFYETFGVLQSETEGQFITTSKTGNGTSVPFEYCSKRFFRQKKA